MSARLAAELKTFAKGARIRFEEDGEVFTLAALAEPEATDLRSELVQLARIADALEELVRVTRDTHPVITGGILGDYEP